MDIVAEIDHELTDKGFDAVALLVKRALPHILGSDVDARLAFSHTIRRLGGRLDRSQREELAGIVDTTLTDAGIEHTDMKGVEYFTPEDGVAVGNIRVQPGRRGLVYTFGAYNTCSTPVVSGGGRIVSYLLHRMEQRISSDVLAAASQIKSGHSALTQLQQQMNCLPDPRLIVTGSEPTFYNLMRFRMS